MQIAKLYARRRPIPVLRRSIEHADPIALVAEQLRNVRRVAAVVSLDDDPVDRLLGMVSIAERGVAV